MDSTGLGLKNQTMGRNLSAPVITITDHYITQWKLRRLCQSSLEKDRDDCIKLCSSSEGRYQDICRGLPAAPTTSTILNAATTIMAEISTSIQQSGECGRSTWNSSHDPSISMPTVCTNTSDPGEGVTMQDCGPSCWPAPFGMFLTVLIAVSMAVCIVVTTFGNLLVIVSFAVDRQIRQPTNYFIASLAVTDVLIGTVSMPFYTVYVLVGYWPDELGPILCDLWLSVDYTVCLVSQFTVLLITVDRFCSVKLATRYRAWRTGHKVIVMIVLTWFIPAILFFVSIFGWEHFVGHRALKPGECMVQFLQDPVFNTSLIISYYWVPLGILFILYAFIFEAAWALSNKSKAKEKERQKQLSSLSKPSGGQKTTSSVVERMPATGHHSSSLKDPEMKPILSNGGSGKKPPTPPVPPGPPTAPKPSTGAPGILQQGPQGPKMPPLEPETEVPGVPTILGPPSNGGVLLPSMAAAAGEKVVSQRDRGMNGFQKTAPVQVSTHLCPTRTAQDLLDAVIVDCKVLNHKNQDIRPPAPSSTGGEVSTEQVSASGCSSISHSSPTCSSCQDRPTFLDIEPMYKHPHPPSSLPAKKDQACGAHFKDRNATRSFSPNEKVHQQLLDILHTAPAIQPSTDSSPDDSYRDSSERRGLRKGEAGFGRRGLPITRARLGGYQRRNKSSTSASSYANSLSESHLNGSESFLPPLIPDPSAPPTSIDSPPRYFSATLPPPKTKMHAASTQTLHHSMGRRSRTSEAKSKRRHPYISASSSRTVSSRSTPRHVSTSTKSTSPITLDPTHLSRLVQRPVMQDQDIPTAACSAAQSFDTFISGRAVVGADCEGENQRPDLTAPTSRDLQNLQNCRQGAEDPNLNKGPHGEPKPGCGLPVACPRPPKPAPPVRKTEVVRRPMVMEAKREEVRVDGRTDVSASSEATEPQLVEASTGTERPDLINKIGKRIRFRRKKKEKIKTENRAKKALKTISLILGAFVTCWTPYHILAIVSSFCPSCINVHIYMLSYFLCYANSPINPFCYAASNQQFKNTFKRIMKGDLSFK